MAAWFRAARGTGYRPPFPEKWSSRGSLLRRKSVYVDSGGRVIFTIFTSTPST